MNKQARLKLCNRLSPDRFEKTAAPLRQMLSNGLKSFNKYLDNLPKYSNPDEGFLKSLWHGITGYLNPKNYVETLKHGIPLYLRNLRDTTFSPQQWKEHYIKNSFDTFINFWAPYQAYKFLTDDNPTNDTEGLTQKAVRNTMNTFDLLDPTGMIMNRGVTGIGSAMLGNMAGRFGAIPAGLKALDDKLGLAPSKEKLRAKLLKRIEQGTPQYMKDNPNASLEEAQMAVLQNTLEAYGPEATQKIFS